MFGLKSTEKLYLMTLKIVAKFERKLKSYIDQMQ